METKTFLSRALGDNGHYCVLAVRLSDGRKIQKFYDTIDKVIDAANNFDSEGFNAYYGLATFKDDSSRKVENVKYLRSFFLDLDCGPEKDFVSQEVAIGELKKFCKQNKLPKPTMLSSGRGVHVYWFLSENIGFADWFPVASRLKNLCKTQKFDADPSVTADAARVLRIPHTHNHKDTPPSEVGFFGITPKFETINFDKFSELLGSDPIPVPTVHVPMELNATMQNLLGNQESIFREILKKTAKRKGCAQLLHIMRNQETMSEPLWRAGLSITKFCSDGEKAMHKISKGHPDYTAEETYKKTSTIKGPYTCARFDEYNPDVCTGCPNWGKIKSPIVLGNQLREATVTDDGVYEAEGPENEGKITHNIPKYPFPYVRGAKGGIYVRTDDGDGNIEEKQIYSNDLYVTQRIRDPELGESLVMKLHLPKDGVREFTIPLSSVTSGEEFRKKLSAEGVAVKKMDQLMAYTLRWIDELQATSTAQDAHIQFGWVGKKFEGFVLGNKLITPDGVKANPPAVQTASYFDYFKPEGTYETWRETLGVWNEDRFAIQQFGFGMGFGSPLMEFMNTNCGAVAFVGETGFGKSLIMYAAAGVWGRPKKLVVDKEATNAFRMNRAEVMHSLITGIDEVTNLDPKPMSDLIYQGTSGQQRGRMTANANVERRQGNEWSLLMQYTTNDSIIEKISRVKAMPKAEAQRILEFPVKKMFDKDRDKAITDKFEGNILGNYGHAGPRYIQWIMNNLDETKDIIRKVQKRVDEIAQLSSENRFWSATITVTIAGLIIAKKIDLHPYNTKKLFQWATTDLVGFNKRYMNDMTASVTDTMNDFFAENISYILQIKSTQDNRGTQGNGLDQHVIPEQIARGRLVARYETDTKLFYVKTKPLKEWCGELQINYQQLISEIMSKCGGKRKKVRLTKGTNLQLPPAATIVMKFDAGLDDDENTEDL